MKSRTSLPALLTLALMLSPSVACDTPDGAHVEASARVKNAAKYIESNPEKALALLNAAPDTKSSTFLFARGRAYESQKAIKEAVADYEAALKLKPKDQIEILRALGRVLPLLGRVDEAREHLTKVVQKSPGDLSTILLLAVLADSAGEAAAVRKYLKAWPGARPEKLRAEPLPAEFHLAGFAVADSLAARAVAQDLAGAVPLTSVSAAVNLARYAQLLEKPDLSKELIAQIIRGDGQKATDEQLEQVAEIALQVGAISLSGRVLDKISVLDMSPQLKVLRAQFLLAHARPREAASLMEEAWLVYRRERNPLAVQLGLRLASTQLRIGKKKEALAVLEKTVKREPALVEAQILLAHAQAISGDDKLKESGMSTLARLAKEDPSAASELGRTQMMIGEYDAAAATFRQSLSRASENDQILQQLVHALNQAKKTSEALGVVSEAVQRAPGSVLRRRLLANQYLKLKQPDRAAKGVEECPETDQNLLDRGLLLADVYQTLGRSQDVERTLRALVKREPRSSRVWIALSLHQISAKKLAEAEESLRVAVELDPADLKQRARLAAVLVALGKHEEAAKAYERLLSHANDDPVALNNIAVLYTDELNELEKGIEYAERAHQLDPKSAALKDTLAWALARRAKGQDLKRALVLMEEARRELDSLSSRYHYGYALIKAGKKEQGRELLEEVLKNAPEDTTFLKDVQSLLKK